MAMPPWMQMQYYGTPGQQQMIGGYNTGGYTGGATTYKGGGVTGTATPVYYGQHLAGFNVPQPRYYGQENAPMGFVESRGYLGTPRPGEYSGYVPGENGRAGYYVGYDPRTGTRTPTSSYERNAYADWMSTTAPELRWVWGF